MKKVGKPPSDPDWIKKKRLHYRFVPRWADGNSLIIFWCTAVSLVASLVSCYMLHAEMVFGEGAGAGLIVWGAGLFFLLITMFFYIKGLYVRFLDSALDVYY